MARKNRLKKSLSLPTPMVNISLLAGLMVLVILFYHPTDANSVNLQTSRLSLGLVGALLLLWHWLWRAKSVKQYTISPNFTHYALWLLLGFGLVSGIWAINIGLFVFKALLWLLLGLCVLLGSLVAINVDNIKKITTILTTGACLLAVIGIAQHLFALDWFYQTVAPSATLGNKNMAMQIITLLLPMSFYVVLTQKTSIKLYWSVLGVVLILTYSFYSQTRSAWVAIGVELMIISAYLLFNKHQFAIKKQTIITLVVALFLLGLLMSFSSSGLVNPLNIIAQKIHSIYLSATHLDGSSISSRYVLWQSAINMWLDNPLIGTGLGSFFHNLNNEGYATYQTIGAKRVHHDGLELLVELGIIGVVLLLIFISFLTQVFYQLIAHTKQNMRLFVMLILTAIIGSFINAQFSFPYQMSVPMMIIGTYFGLILALFAQLNQSYTTRQFTINQHATPIALGMVGILLLVVIIIYQSWYQNSHRMTTIINLAQNNQTTPLNDNQFYTPFYLSKLNSMADSTYNNGHYKASLALLKQARHYLPNNWSYCLGLVHRLTALKQYSQALNQANDCQKILPIGSFAADIFKLDIYNKTGDIPALKKIYNDLKSKPQALLAIAPITYQTLLKTAIKLDQETMVVIFYQKYQQYHQNTAKIELSMVRYYLSKNQFLLAQPHAKKALDFDGISPANRTQLERLINYQP